MFDRTPNASNANNVRICNTGNGGALNNNNANNANGAAPIGGIVSFDYLSERIGKAVRLPQGVCFLHPKGAKTVVGWRQRESADPPASPAEHLNYGRRLF